MSKSWFVWPFGLCNGLESPVRCYSYEEALDKAFEYDKLTGVSVDIEYVPHSEWMSASDIHKLRLENEQRRV